MRAAKLALDTSGWIRIGEPTLVYTSGAECGCSLCCTVACHLADCQLATLLLSAQLLLAAQLEDGPAGHYKC
jgi:hypothetical protein